jgi:hypothetical protein
MVTIIKKGTKRAELDKKLESIGSSKKLDAKRFSGVIKLEEDPLVIQKRMRDEW